jgi:hypothetical protein
MTLYLVRDTDHGSEDIDPVDNKDSKSAASSDDWGTPPRSQAQGAGVGQHSVLEQVGESGHSTRHQVSAGEHNVGFSHSTCGSEHGGDHARFGTLHIN